MRLRSAFAAVALFLFAAAPAAAEERITRFSSDVQIRSDASLDVTETIDIIAEHNQINRGIFRDFPTRYRGRNGSQVLVGFDFVSVTRDGQPEPAKLESISGGVRIKIGDPDKLIDVGEHRYVIRYRTDRQIGRFDAYDELYWNATGTTSIFPIDTAEARIRLPKQVPFGQLAFYTGPHGSTDRNAEIVEQKPGDISFRTTRPLAAREGLTVAVAFPKGVIADEDRAGYWLTDYGPLIVGALALVAVGIFYFFAWARAGRNPRAGTMVPIFSPPDGLSPAAMRYIWKMGVDDRAFAAAVVDAGVKGHVRLVEEDGGFLGLAPDKMRLHRLAGTEPLPDAEQSMLTQLAMTGETIVMEKKNHEKFSAARKMLDSAFKRDFEGTMFKRNWGWAFAGIAIVIAAVWATAAAVDAATGVMDPMSIGISIGSMLTTGLLLLALRGTSTTGKCLIGGIALIGAAVSFAFGLPVLMNAFQVGWYAPLVLPLLALPLMISSFFWIAAPTREGRGVLDRIMGFRHYLSVAEGPRLDRMTRAPTPTIELFEKYLPFAIALGVENKWADKFKDMLAAAQAAGHQGFSWYSGSSTPWNNTGGFVTNVGSGLASTLSAASAAPGSSSGSGGGGFSGGGGGGGGVGGW